MYRLEWQLREDIPHLELILTDEVGSNAGSSLEELAKLDGTALVELSLILPEVQETVGEVKVLGQVGSSGFASHQLFLSEVQETVREVEVLGQVGGSGLTGVVVGVCGPLSLAHGVRKAVAEFDPARRKTIGGIELHEE